jgi:hypothetical protein
VRINLVGELQACIAIAVPPELSGPDDESRTAPAVALAIERIQAPPGQAANALPQVGACPARKG